MEVLLIKFTFFWKGSSSCILQGRNAALWGRMISPLLLLMANKHTKSSLLTVYSRPQFGRWPSPSRLPLLPVPPVCHPAILIKSPLQRILPLPNKPVPGNSSSIYFYFIRKCPNLSCNWGVLAGGQIFFGVAHLLEMELTVCDGNIGSVIKGEQAARDCVIV